MDDPQTSSSAIVPAGAGPLDRNPAAVYLASLTSAAGRRTQQQALGILAHLVSNGAADCFTTPWHQLRYQHAVALRAQLVARYAPATVNKFLSALRGVLKQAWRLELIAAEDYQRAIDLPPAVGSRLPAGRAARPNEIYRLLSVCQEDSTPAGARDAAMIALMVGCGFRRDEMPHLLFENFHADADAGEGLITVIGKRQKERDLPVVNGAYDALADWLEVRGDAPGPIFFPIDKAGHLKTHSMTNQAVYNMLKKRLDQARIQALSPHDLRRTFISDLLDAGADIATVARLAGHANIQTTMRYDRRPEETKRKAARLLHVPYHGRGT